jgi:hypothetical protein
MTPMRKLENGSSFCSPAKMTRWARRLAWQQSQSFEAWSVSLHSQGRMDDWMRGPVEELALVARLTAQDALRERLSLVVELAREH